MFTRSFTTQSVHLRVFNFRLAVSRGRTMRIRRLRPLLCRPPRPVRPPGRPAQHPMSRLWQATWRRRAGTACLPSRPERKANTHTDTPSRNRNLKNPVLNMILTEFVFSESPGHPTNPSRKLCYGPFGEAEHASFISLLGRHSECTS